MPHRMRLVAGLGLTLLLLAAPAPASAPRTTLTAALPVPAVAVVPNCGPPVPQNPTITVLTYSIEVIGWNLGIYKVWIVFNPPQVPGPSPQNIQGSPDLNGHLDQVIHPALVAPGTYRVAILDLDYQVMATALFQVPCPRPPSPSPSVPPSPIPGVPPRVLNPTLTLTPAIGPPGTVTVAHGSDFPHNVPIQLAWSQGIAGTISSPIVTDANGAFTATALVYPHDELGTRVLTAVSIEPPNSSLFGFADAPFLVVPGEVQPRDFASRR